VSNTIEIPTLLALPSIGSQLWYGDGASPENWTLITNAAQYKGLSLSGKAEDVTNNNTTNPWRRKIVTLLDAGDMQFDLYFIPNDSGHKAIVALFTGRGLPGAPNVPIQFKLVFSDAAQTPWYFDGFITKLDLAGTIDSVWKFSAMITAEGQPVFPS
jgi:hypothetical protein